MSRRCICGRSSRLPLCDGAHALEGWRCSAAEPTIHPRVFAAGPSGRSIVERLAHAHRGAALHRLRGPVRTEQLVVVSDGTDLDHIALHRVDAEATRLLLLGADPALFGAAIAGATVVAVADSAHPAVLWRNLEAALSAPGTPLEQPGSVFISHAASDEALLQPAVDTLRKLGITVFSCGDSIPAGTRWYDEILMALHACDRFVSVLTKASRASTWCAFEAGAAVATGKPIQLVSVDGLPPPSFLSHVQMQDVPRARQLRPWLSDDDAILEALLAPVPHLLATPPPRGRPKPSEEP